MIMHILSRSEWELARALGEYRPPSLEAEGFIHCSTVAQVINTANIFYRGHCDLLVLRIDERMLTARLAFEPPVNSDDARPLARFPHIYGPLNLDAVFDAIELPCGVDGLFSLPAALVETD